MHQADQHPYSCIARLIEQGLADFPTSWATAAKLCQMPPEQLEKRILAWSAGTDLPQIRYYLSRTYARQQLRQTLDGTHQNKTNSSVQLKTLSTHEFHQRSTQLNIAYGSVDSPFGQALLGFNTDGICHITFQNHPHDEAETKLRECWPTAKLHRDQTSANQFAEQLFQPPNADKPVIAWTYGTDFQIRVWQTLLQLPAGGLIHYQHLATQAGAPKAARAVGSAMAKNHLSWLIPCHRVLRQSGDFGQYGGGTERKMAMVAYEASRLRQTG